MSRELRRGEHIGELPGQLNGIRETGPLWISRYRYTPEEHRVDRFETLGEALEDTIHGDGKLKDIHALRRELIRLRKVIWPLRTVFIPLAFIAGIYGMNFVHMPELEWRFAYPGVLGFMATVAGVMLVSFRRRRWL